MMFEWRWDPASPTSDLSLLNSAIIRASKRGVAVSALSNFGDILQKLKDMDAQAKIWASNGNMHAKIIVIDGETCIVGSHNFSQNAFSKNIEISVLFSDIAVAAQIKNYFNILWRQ
jgi:phosphatidylserine/phosphatidylglycerophosphate/cardiolipin synthase-like enzyme